MALTDEHQLTETISALQAALCRAATISETAVKLNEPHAHTTTGANGLSCSAQRHSHSKKEVEVDLRKWKPSNASYPLCACHAFQQRQHMNSNQMGRNPNVNFSCNTQRSSTLSSLSSVAVQVSFNLVIGYYRRCVLDPWSTESSYVFLQVRSDSIDDLFNDHKNDDDDTMPRSPLFLTSSNLSNQSVLVLSPSSSDLEWNSIFGSSMGDQVNKVTTKTFLESESESIHFDCSASWTGSKSSCNLTQCGDDNHWLKEDQNKKKTRKKMKSSVYEKKPLDWEETCEESEDSSSKDLVHRIPLITVKCPRELPVNRKVTTLRESQRLMNAVTRGVCIDYWNNRRIRCDPVALWYQYQQYWNRDQ